MPKALDMHRKTSETAPFEKWLDFLLFSNEEPATRELLTHYLFDQFAPQPERFYEFMLFFKKVLHRKGNPQQKKKMAHQYLAILSTLCERFSFFEEKSALDDLCFKIRSPEDYRDIDHLLSRYKPKAQKLIHQVLKTLALLLEKEKYDADVKGRYKSLYSIYRKVQKKGKKSVLNLNDIFAFRVILNTPRAEDCFEVLNLFHDRFTPIADLFKDYITIPKINGYQSLHTGLKNVIPDLDLPIEVQIRTTFMNDFAEHGLAAHWLYAHDKETKLVTEKEEKLLHHFSDLSREQEERHVTFFSYVGDLFKMEKGTSVLDFASHVHTGLGRSAKGALVNGAPQPLSYLIQEGDAIQIIKSKR